MLAWTATRLSSATISLPRNLLSWAEKHKGHLLAETIQPGELKGPIWTDTDLKKHKSLTSQHGRIPMCRKARGKLSDLSCSWVCVRGNSLGGAWDPHHLAQWDVAFKAKSPWRAPAISSLWFKGLPALPDSCSVKDHFLKALLYKAEIFPRMKISNMILPQPNQNDIDSRHCSHSFWWLSIAYDSLHSCWLHKTSIFLGCQGPHKKKTGLFLPVFQLNE